MIEGASLRIAVLLSTYNGESYLAAQLDSLLAQNDTDRVTDSGGTVPIDEDIYEKAMEAEYKMFQFRDCPYTDEMGDHMFECIKEYDGFNAHGCFKDSERLFCPESSDYEIQKVGKSCRPFTVLFV